MSALMTQCPRCGRPVRRGHPCYHCTTLPPREDKDASDYLMQMDTDDAAVAWLVTP